MFKIKMKYHCLFKVTLVIDREKLKRVPSSNGPRWYVPIKKNRFFLSISFFVSNVKKKYIFFFVDHVVTIEASFQTVFGQLTFDRK